MMFCAFCSGTAYTYNNANQNYGAMNINETINNANIKLYAVWLPDFYDVTIKTNAGSDIDNGYSEYDICPKGWSLPTDDDYRTLINTYTTCDALSSSPFNAVMSGDYLPGYARVVNNTSTKCGSGSEGVYWTSHSS